MIRKNDFVMKKVMGENIVVPIGSEVMNLNGMIILNDSGAYLWELLEQERTFEELVDSMMKHFKLDAVNAGNDLQIFLDEINKIGLLKT